MKTFIKDPDAVLDYAIDWSGWLQDGEAIETSTWTAGDGISTGAESLSGAVATVWLSGGTTGSRYVVTNRIVTSSGRQDDRSMTISCTQR